ncbi:MAG: hypothetical protein A2V67_00880 [Deltaproteobacteria bacterium RBG_13_61_14]|jgi:NADH-quinone oxidoreductase subunit I|nr:MAG: hypothetical protein A2V67_00880 [Deltaproteobacteria bacterium RBG_13_61_14]
MAVPKITVDYGKCTDPLSCTFCMNHCPYSVFIVGETRVYKFRETPLEEFRVYGRYYDRCDGCNVCVQGCPKQAISVTF